MKYKEEFFKRQFSNINQISEIELSQIPLIELYNDQVTSFLNDYLQEYSAIEGEVIVTKAMINNYAKAKILPPINNKKYNRSHIILLIMIYKLKQILSLNEIKILLTPFVTILNSDYQTHLLLLEEMYQNYINYTQDTTISIEECCAKILVTKYTYDELNLHQNICQQILIALVIATKNQKQKLFVQRLINAKNK